MNTTRSEAQWPYDERSDQVHAQQVEDRRRMQEDLQGAWERLLEDRELGTLEGTYKPRATESDIKLLKWALGVK